MQLYWSFFNALLDEGINILPEDIDEFDDYYLYELAKHTDMDVLTYRFNTTKEAIMERINSYAALQERINKALKGEMGNG